MSTQPASKQHCPFGQWPSTISAELVGGKSPRLSEPLTTDLGVFWLQTLPEEKGRTAIMLKPRDELNDTDARCILPRPLSVKSKVHEYGGGGYWVEGSQLYFVLADDQQVYTADITSSTMVPTPLTSSRSSVSAETDSELRYADLTPDLYRQHIIAVCEEHLPNHCGAKEAATRLVSIPTDGSGVIDIIAEGDDFYSSPSVSPCGQYLTWLSWNHPDMPWDATQLWLATRSANGKFEQHASTCIVGARKRDGNTPPESLFLPRFAPDGRLFFVSDRNNWWNLYAIEANTLASAAPTVHAVTTMEAEFATPQWTFRMSTYDFLSNDEILATYSQNGRWYLQSITCQQGVFHTQTINACTPESEEFTVIHGISCHQQHAAFIAAGPTRMPQVLRLEKKPSAVKIVNCSATELSLHAEDISVPQALSFPSGNSNSAVAHAFFYSPTNALYHNNDELPPLIVICHGGPTGATDNALNLKVQYWTNRGFAVMDVNYRGSTGYGRQFRQQLQGNWGIFDVEDVCAAANYAAKHKLANPKQLIIKGSSAGGYTVLAALTFADCFKAGVSLYGIGNLETLVHDTHKFEARYLDSLIGDYAKTQQRYIDRSPIHFVGNINCPLLVFQGREDKVVPPNQAELMVDAVKQKGLHVDYTCFEDEGHGFRKASTIKTMLDKELNFYKQVFKL